MRNGPVDLAVATPRDEVLASSLPIHAPAKGATRVMIFQVFMALVSIHAPVKGATRRPCLRSRVALFQSTPP